VQIHIKNIVISFHIIPKIKNYGNLGTPYGFKKAPHTLLRMHNNKAIIYGQKYEFKYGYERS
jgi:hypothetical protein